MTIPRQTRTASPKLPRGCQGSGTPRKGVDLDLFLLGATTAPAAKPAEALKVSLDDEQMGAPLPEAHSAAVGLRAQQGEGSTAIRPDLHLAFGLSYSGLLCVASGECDVLCARRSDFSRTLASAEEAKSNIKPLNPRP